MLMHSLRKPSGLPRLLILGCGDVGMRLLPLLRARFRVFAVTSQPARCAQLRAAGAVPIVANLDDRASLKRLAGLATMDRAPGAAPVVGLAGPAHAQSGRHFTRACAHGVCEHQRRVWRLRGRLGR